MDLDEEARNFCRLVILLIKVGKPKLRLFFIDQWNAVKGHRPWTDCEKNGQDLLRMFTPPAHEVNVIKSGNTLEWSLTLVIQVLLRLEKPLFIKKSRIKAIKYLGELREEVGRNRETEIRKDEFKKKWDDACTTLTLFGATSKDFKETKKDVKQWWGDLCPFLIDLLSYEKDILELLPTLQAKSSLQNQSSEFRPESKGPWPLDIPCSSRGIAEFDSVSDFVGEAEPALSRSRGIPIHTQGAFEARPKVILPYRESGNEYAFRVAYDDFPGWQFFDASEHGFCLDVPPFTAFTLSSSSSRIMCSLVSDDFCIPPDGANETLVSYIVDFDLSFPGRDRKGPVIITLAHSGADRSLGYETVVKSFDKYQRIYNWREIKEHMPRRTNRYEGTNSVQVLVYLPTTLAVVTRPITQRFLVTPWRRNVVTSSVCDDVTIEFPDGAVKKNVEGTMKLMLMPKDIPHARDACPILCVDGLSNITFLKPVIVKMPIPNNAADYSKNKIRLLRLENDQLEDGKWRDVTHLAHILKFKNHIEFHFTHFSCLWPWMSGAKTKFASTIFRYLRAPPRAVCFAAFKDNEEASPQSVPKLTLLCVANHKQCKTVCNMRGEGYSRLAVATGDRKMRPNDKAYLRVSGADMNIERFFLRFLKGEVCRKELSVHDPGQDQDTLEELVLNFFPNLEENLDLLLGTLRMSKDIVFLRRRGERQRGLLADQQEVEEEAQPLQGAVANLPLMSPTEEEEQDGDGVSEGIRDLVSSFGGTLVNLDAEEVAERLPLYLGVDRTLIADPPYDVMQKCQQFCRCLKNHGRKDIVKALRDVLPSGMTGPLMDGKSLVRDLGQATKTRLSRALSAHDEWKIFAEKIDGITNIDIEYYSERTRNPVMEILNDNCADMKIDTLYRLLVESNANAIADFL